jgi:hypothetical protein
MSLLVLGTVAGGLAATEMRERKRSGKQIIRKLKTAHEFKLALAETGGLGASGLILVSHLMVWIP